MDWVAKQMPKKRCQSIPRLCFKDAAPQLSPNAPEQMHKARLLFFLIQRMDQKQFRTAINKLHNSHPVEGPRAVSWLFSTMARRIPHEDRQTISDAAEQFMEEAVAMRKIGKLWSSETAWEAVHGKEPRTLPRYHSADSFFAAKTSC